MIIHTQSEMICVFACQGHEKYYVSCCYFQFQTKVKRGTWTIGIPVWTLDPTTTPQKNGVMGLILLNLGDCPVQDPGKGSGRNGVVFSWCRYFVTGLNFDSSEMISINIGPHQRMKMMTN